MSSIGLSDFMITFIVLLPIEPVAIYIMEFEDFFSSRTIKTIQNKRRGFGDDLAFRGRFV